MVTMIFLFSLLFSSLLSSYTDDETHARQITIVRCTRAKTEENDDDDNDDDDDDNALFTFNEHRAENYRSLMATAFSYLTTTN